MLKPTLHVGYVPASDSTDSVNACVQLAKSVASLAKVCKGDTGAYVQPMAVLAPMLAYYYNLKMITVPHSLTGTTALAKLTASIENNATDISLRVYALTEQRLAHYAAFSQPVMLYKRVFLVNSRAFTQHHDEITLNPFELIGLVCILIALGSYIVLETLYLYALRILTQQTLCAVFQTSLIDFSDFSGLRNRGITKLWVGRPAAVAYLFATSLILRSSYNSFLTANLMHDHRAPFASFEEFAQLARNKKLTLVYNTGLSYLSYANESATWRAVMLSAHLVKTAKTGVQLVSEEPSMVYLTTSAKAKYSIADYCGKLRVIEPYDLSSERFAFIVKRDFTFEQKLNRVIGLAREELEKQFERPLPSKAYCDMSDNKLQTARVQLVQLKTLFVVYCCVCFISIAILCVELRYKDR